MGDLWLFAGPNGAGKSTYVAEFTGVEGALAGITPLNPDTLTLELLQAKGYQGYAHVPDEVYKQCFLQAAEAMLARAQQQIRSSEAVCLETVLSTRKYLPLVQEALRTGANFYFVYVFLDSPERACARVARRVVEGGHPVPADRVVARYHRSLEIMPEFAKLATAFWVYDNTAEVPVMPYHPAALGEGGKLLEFDGHAPEVILQRLSSLIDPESSFGSERVE